jgi:hypothetical protein
MSADSCFKVQTGRSEVSLQPLQSNDGGFGFQALTTVVHGREAGPTAPT